MEESIKVISKLADTVGLRNFAVAAAVVAIVSIIKIPLVRLGKSIEARTGADKCVVTRYAAFLPVITAFVLHFIIGLYMVGWNAGAVDFADVAARALSSAALAIALYESVKIQLEAYAAKKNSRPQPDPAGDDPASEESGTVSRAESEESSEQASEETSGTKNAESSGKGNEGTSGKTSEKASGTENAVSSVKENEETSGKENAAAPTGNNAPSPAETCEEKNTATPAEKSISAVPADDVPSITYSANN